ncbi:MAG: NADPH-dependent FMN reductase [Syntrophus sp. PtaU1.Bin208]|nr:MAG: NADPH-dependent FMN reductase [Syntrophus sp. PtaU1.Bin208]
MRGLILNGSARGQKGVTGKMLDALTRGLSKASAELKTFELRRMSISPCTGCLSCMHKNPGVCVLQDDMGLIYEALKTSDLLIMATPLYVDTMSAQLKTVMDRCLACLQPFLVKDETGRVRHPFNWRMPAKFLLLSTSAFPELEVFAALIATFRAEAANFNSKAVGEICIPGSIALQMEPELLDRHLSLLEEAGRVLAGTGSIPESLLRELNTPPLDVERYLQVATKYEDWCRAQLSKSK